MHRDSIQDDCRAIEGMPIRLVVAISVGAAAMSLVFPMLDAVEETDRPEITAEVDSQQIVLDETTPRTVTVAVVTGNGRPVQDSTVLISEGSLPLVAGPQTFATGPDSHEVTVSISEFRDADLTAAFRTTQRRGTIEIGVLPPGDRSFRGHAAPPEITVRKP